MESHELKQTATVGGICGVAGTVFYILAVAGNFPDRSSYVMAMAWPVLSIVFAHALYRVIASERDGVMNRLAFIFACIGFALVACMISVQLAVKVGVSQFMADSIPGDENVFGVIRRVTRLVDMGMDVAWDVFIGSSLVCLSFALPSHPRFGRAWGIPAGVFGTGLIALNVYTFPWPPNTEGLFDLGPFIGLFIILLSSRMLLLRRADLSRRAT